MNRRILKLFCSPRIYLGQHLFLSVESVNTKRRAEGHTRRAFINFRRVVVQAGNGGDGCIAFQHLFRNAKAGPSGGNGGNGGHVIFRANSRTTDLSQIPSIIRGTDGGRGHGDHRHGASAEHTYIQVPPHTEVFLVSPEGDPTESVAVLQNEGDLYLAARGGAGGKSNAFLTSAASLGPGSAASLYGHNPLRVAERGASGESSRLCLRMVNLANLGLVGAPNAGKSTLLRRLTRARPKVAPYPFTTVKPHIGILSLPGSQLLAGEASGDEGKTLTVADLPGILPGAAEFNRGLGAEFLSLITDCQSLAYVVDVGTIWLDLVGAHSPDNDEVDRLTQPLLAALAERLAQLKHELVTFSPRLGMPRHCLVIGTKADLIFPGPQPLVDHPRPAQFTRLTDVLTRAARQANLFSATPDQSTRHTAVLVSARRGDNIQELVDAISRGTPDTSR